MFPRTADHRGRLPRGRWVVGAQMATGAFLAIFIALGFYNIPSFAGDPPLPLRNQTDVTLDRIVFATGDSQRLALPGGEVRKIASLLRVAKPLRYGQFVWSVEAVPEGNSWVRVDLDKQILSIFRGEHEIGTGVILYGADSKPTPTGRFSILERIRDHRSNLYDAPMPYTLRLTHDGIAIHGSNVVRGMATHGCIGIPSAFAKLIFDALRRGDPVYVVK